MLCILSAVFKLRALLYVLCAFVILNKRLLTYLHGKKTTEPIEMLFERKTRVSPRIDDIVSDEIAHWRHVCDGTICAVAAMRHLAILSCALVSLANDVVCTHVPCKHRHTDVTMTV